MDYLATNRVLRPCGVGGVIPITEESEIGNVESLKSVDFLAGDEQNAGVISFMPKTIVKPAKAAPALGPYNHGVRVGDFLFCAGQIPLDPANPSGPLPADIRAQTERVLENIRIILEDQKLTFAHVVKTTVFMINLGDFAAMNEVYAKYFTADFPARSTVQVAALPRGAQVEIEVIAHL